MLEGCQGASSRMGGDVCRCWAGPRQNNENMRNQGPLSWGWDAGAPGQGSDRRKK